LLKSQLTLLCKNHRDYSSGSFTILSLFVTVYKITSLKRLPIPLKQMPLDIAFIVFFFFNLVFVTYMIDLEQVLILDVNHFDYPLWPPAWLIDLSHWYGRTFDPLLMARPPFWRATIWIDQLFFGPYYAIAIYAFAKGKDWIRFGSIIWAAVMLTNVTIILFEEAEGQFASPDLLRVVLANASWIIFPLLMLYKMWRSIYPFTIPNQNNPFTPRS